MGYSDEPVLPTRKFGKHCGTIRGESGKNLPKNPLFLEYTDYESWKVCAVVRGWITQRDRGDGERLEIPLPELDSAMGLRYLYERYRYWHDGENELSDMMFHSKGSHPPLNLVPFPNLEALAVLGARELWEDLEWCSHRADCRVQEKQNRKSRETAIDPRQEATILRLMQRNTLLGLTLQMFNASGVNMTRLELHRYREALMDETFPIPALKQLRELALDFSDPDAEELVHAKQRWELASWLLGAENLELLKLAQDSRHLHVCPYFDVIALFYKASLALDGVIVILQA